MQRAQGQGYLGYGRKKELHNSTRIPGIIRFHGIVEYYLFQERSGVLDQYPGIYRCGWIRSCTSWMKIVESPGILFMVESCKYMMMIMMSHTVLALDRCSTRRGSVHRAIFIESKIYCSYGWGWAAAAAAAAAAADKFVLDSLTQNDERITNNWIVPKDFWKCFEIPFLFRINSLKQWIFHVKFTYLNYQ